MKNPAIQHRAGRGGFTLLEVVMAMLLLALLAGMIFNASNANLQLGNTVVKRQAEEAEKHAFFQLLAQRFAAMPGNTRMELLSKDAGTHYLSDLTLQNVPLNFTWAGAEKVAKAVQLSTVLRRDGYLDIVMRYYEEEIIEDSDNAQSNTKIDPFAEVVLLEDVRTFEWRVLDGRTMEWQYDWDLVGRLPLQMELTIAFGKEGEAMRQIFWITPKQDPEVAMRTLQQQAQSGAIGGGQGGQGGVQIDLGGGGGGGRGPGGGGGGGGRGPGGGGGGFGGGGGGGRGPGGGGGPPGGGGGGGPGGGR